MADRGAKTARWISGAVETPVGTVPRVRTALVFGDDRLGRWRVRWGIGRYRYRVAPGLYAVGNAGPRSPVLVTANFKMSFDELRSTLGGRDAWILVLDTRGINVWCAAGEGTFGTEELLHRLAATRLGEIVAHRTVVLPQLGAPGVSAHEVRERVGWRVVYGPVRAEDVPAFLDAGMKAGAEMRRVRFPLRARAAVVPVELVTSARYLLPAIALFVVLAGLGTDGFSTARMEGAGLRAAFLLAGAWAAGVVVTPLLLPWIPGRAFAWKGICSGAAVLALWMAFAAGNAGAPAHRAELCAWLLLVPAVSSFLAMNFTGCTTFTSLSGVRREMRWAVPCQIAAALVGVGLWVAARFLASGGA